MSKVLVALAVSVDGYVTGRDPGAGRGLGDATMLFDWYFDGDTPSQVFEGFFQSLPEHVRLHLREAIPAPGVTHLHYEVIR